MNRILPAPVLVVLAVAASLGLSAAQPAAAAAPPAKSAKPARACFPARSVNSFAAVDDKNLYVRVGVRDVYHLAMFGNCFDLSWTHALGLVSKDGAFICEGSSASVDVVTRDAGSGPQSCPVTDIRRLTPEEVAALPKKARP